MSEAEILKRLGSSRENLSPMRRVKHLLGLSPAAESLIFHHSTEKTRQSLDELVHAIKNFRVELVKPRPLDEAISSRGGLSLEELDSNFSLKKFPQIFCGGEMLDWDAPTGGFLIQACISQGAWIGKQLSLR